MSATTSASIPDMVSIKATEVSPPPAWALLERRLIALMEKGPAMMIDKYAERSGAWLWSDDMDDYYERSYNWCLLYAMGGDESLVDLALQQWNATTRLFDARHGNRANNLDYFHGVHPMTFKHSNHNEYFSLAAPGDAEWHHMGEGNMAFYDFAVADPTISENVRRARRFAAMYIGEDPEAPNWDPEHKILRSPMNSSQGPWHHVKLEEAMSYLQGGHAEGNPEWTPKTMGVRASLYPAVKELEPNWWKDSKRADEVVKLFDHVLLNGDSAANLAATGLVTNAYLYTGDEKYKRWVLEYVEAWMERIKQNDGIIPDNVGPTGKPGENRDGVWWGGIYGWNSYVGYSQIFHAVMVAAECALLLTGDFGYLELLRSQINVLMDNSFTGEDGQLLVPSRRGPNGWESEPHPDWRGADPGPQPMRIYDPAHLYHASMSKEDHDLIVRMRDGNVETDWNEEKIGGVRAEWDTEYSRFQYYDGKNPDWPEKILGLQLQMALETYQTMRLDERSVSELIEANEEPRNPVFTKVLTQVMMGSPQSAYHGGLLRATVRYYDEDRVRPGLPPDVAALVDELKPDGVGVQLVNTNRHEPRSLSVQAGAFGEHEFTDVRFRHGEVERNASIHGKYFSVELPPSTSIRVDAGLHRFVNQPSYAFPWHADGIPIPFQY